MTSLLFFDAEINNLAAITTEIAENQKPLVCQISSKVSSKVQGPRDQASPMAAMQGSPRTIAHANPGECSAQVIGGPPPFHHFGHSGSCAIQATRTGNQFSSTSNKTKHSQVFHSKADSSPCRLLHRQKGYCVWSSLFLMRIFEHNILAQ